MTEGPRHLVMVSDASATCGVEAFSRLTAERLAPRSATHVLGLHGARLKRALRQVDSLVLNFPIVAWKKKLLEPMLAALTARMMGKAVVVVLHEWTDLDWKRRLALSPVCLLATAILFSAPEVAAQFAASPTARAATRRRGVIPIPPNVIPAACAARSTTAEALRAQRRMGRLILGQFGSIYPKKHSARVLDVAARLIEAGRDVAVVFVGSFIKGQDTIETDLYRRADALGLSDRVMVTGYIDDTETLSGIFAEIDAFAYAFQDGLTERRASVLTAALSGKPVIVNAPRSREGLDRHPLFAALIADRLIRLAPTGADPVALARLVLDSLAVRHRPRLQPEAAIADLWGSIVSVIDEAVAGGRAAQRSSVRLPDVPLVGRQRADTD